MAPRRAPMITQVRPAWVRPAWANRHQPPCCRPPAVGPARPGCWPAAVLHPPLSEPTPCCRAAESCPPRRPPLPPPPSQSLQWSHQTLRPATPLGPTCLEPSIACCLEPGTRAPCPTPLPSTIVWVRGRAGQGWAGGVGWKCRRMPARRPPRACRPACLLPDCEVLPPLLPTPGCCACAPLLQATRPAAGATSSRSPPLRWRAPLRRCLIAWE